MRTKHFRSKTRCGLSVRWGINTNKDGKWKIVSLGEARNGRDPFPTALLPFDLTNAVINGPAFKTQGEAEIYARGL